MPNQGFKEPFTGKYDGVTPPSLLPPSWISGGKNMRKISPTGGWKVRKGGSLHNTTAIASASVKSLHKYENPRNEDEHLIAQCNGLLYDATNVPPSSGTSFGTSLGVNVGTTPGFSCVVGERWFYADGSGTPISWGGDAPLPLAFVVYDGSSGSYVNYVGEIADPDTTPRATILKETADRLYVITNEVCSAVVFDLATVNSNASVLTVKAWRSGAWTAVSGLSDGTASGGATFALDGTVSWTRSASDELKVVGNVLGYVYEFSWSAQLSNSVTVDGATTTQQATSLSNKWDGTWWWVTGCRFYDESAGEYQEHLGDVTNESTFQYVDLSSATTSDFLYLKTPEPATGFLLGIASDYTNTEDAEIDGVECWSEGAWVAASSIDDGTLDDDEDSSFSQSGFLFFDASALTPTQRTLEGDNQPGYWYRVSWDAALSSGVRVYAAYYAPFPEQLTFYDGCVEFKGRLFLWGDPEHPNQLRYSAEGRPDCFSGLDSGWTDPFGGGSKIVCALNFYNELLVFKESGKGVWLLEGYNPETFGSIKIADTLGLASPKTAMVVEVGSPGMKREEPLSIAIWEEVDGVYVLDGRKPRKVSKPFVDNYFNPESGDCIAAADIQTLQAFPDPVNTEYHLLLPSAELVYNYATDEWYPPWEREQDLTTGIALQGSDGRLYTYGGTGSGFVLRLENGTADKNTSDVDVAIEHSLKTRAVAVEPGKGPTFRFSFRYIWAVMKAQSAGSITVKTFKDESSTGVSQGTMSLVEGGAGIVVRRVDVSIENCSCIEVEFSCSTVDVELLLYSWLYELDARGRLGG